MESYTTEPGVAAPGLPDVTMPQVTAACLHVGDGIAIAAPAEARSLPELFQALRAVVLEETADARARAHARGR